jgi:iron complex outermembrane receptor protein
VFYMNYDDKQEEQSVPTSQGTGPADVVVNASSAEIYGLEIDLAAAITESFMLTANLGLLDASYKELIDPLTGTDLSDLDLRRAPPVTATLSPSYTDRSRIRQVLGAGGLPLHRRTGAHVPELSAEPRRCARGHRRLGSTTRWATGRRVSGV